MSGKCSICNSPITPFLDYGNMPLADRFLTKGMLEDIKIKGEKYYPLKLCHCIKCGLTQLETKLPSEELYNDTYIYDTSQNSAGVIYYHKMADTLVDFFNLKSKDLVVDIGSNTGVLLQGFKKHKVRVCGVEPVKLLADKASQKGIPTINSIFDMNAAGEIIAKYGKASMVTGTNVIGHIAYQHELVELIRKLLKPNGWFIFEAPYLFNMLDNLEYDTVYHEHLFYYCITPLERLFSRHQMSLQNITRHPIHGGVARYYIRNTTIRQNNDVSAYLHQENKAGIHKMDIFRQFTERVKRHSLEFRRLLEGLHKYGKTIWGISAPAKGMVLLNYCGIKKDIVEYITEKSPLKIKHYTPGNHIPIISDSELFKRRPDYAIILAWNFKDNIMNHLKRYTGKFIVPIPKMEIICR